ncbi:MAG TPA: DNA ligase D [Solirubrobacteraceae bacterium]|nr:DNA ligase D [Solirubrobacteraceae bacterium]
MSGSLRTYRAKRDFETSPEPRGRAAGGDDRFPRFVVQEHSARSLHWDLRLEHDGVLWSWAVPRGIPDAPEDNHLAVRTEDHPLEYLDFHGEIPAGEYGAGTMTIYDRGTYEPEKLRDDEVIAVFHGERMSGRYALFRTRGKDWMIHRMDPPVDPDREPMPERLQPMLARTGTLPPDTDGRWAYEVKWDGIRTLAWVEGGRVRLCSRNGNDITSRYPELRDLGRALGARRAILDGEIVAFDPDGRPSFERLQARMNLANEAAVRRAVRDVPIAYVLFDVLYLDARTTCALPYTERRALLEGLDLNGPRWQTPAYRTTDAPALLEVSAQRGLEGVVAKRLDSRYEPGRRSSGWVKVKNKRNQTVVIGGWVPGEGRRRSTLGALLVSVPDEEGRLDYAGRVGTGFTERTLRDLQAQLEKLETDRSPFSGRKPPRLKGARWVEPKLVAEVEFSEWTRSRTLRAPSFKGLRDDVDPDHIDREDEEADDLAALERALQGAGTRKGSNRVEVEIGGRTLSLSNLNKVMYPATGFTKGQVTDYHARIAPVLLPHLHDRPLTLKRYPDGVDGPFFYEKQSPAHRPAWVQTAAIWSRHNARTIEYTLAQDLPTLVWLANLADLELHTSLALAADITRPTMLVFDLDPGEPAAVLECAQVALWVRDLFEALGLESCVKTSGSKGLQAYVPLNTPVTYDDTKPFAQAVAQLLEKQHPDLVVSSMAKELRKGKVLVDWSQNDEHKTTVNVYSLRARERPTVSTPLEWDEVASAVAAGDPDRLVFTSDDVLDRTQRLGDLFAPLLEREQALPRL